jgi:hypothetical protein
VTCERPGCAKPLNTGARYCSKSCAALDRKRQLEIPQQIKQVVGQAAGDQANIVLEALQLEDLEIDPNKISTQARTFGGWVLSIDGKDHRPHDSLDFDKIELMENSGVVRFAKRMVMARILAAFSHERKARFESPDDELAEVVTANARDFLPKMIYFGLDNALPTGAGFIELVWGNKTKYELGLSKGRGGRAFTVIVDVKPVATDTIDHIRRDNRQRFNGFVQAPGRRTLSPTSKNEVTVEMINAFILTYEEKDRNKWGVPLYQAIYPLWFWYQVILRSMVRYMERMGSPVTVVKAPPNRKVRKPGSTDYIDAFDLGLQIAINASKSNALVVPSSHDAISGEPEWEVSYLTAEERAQPFMDVLEAMFLMILRTALLLDRSMTGGEAGARSLGDLHEVENSIHDQMTISHITWQINDHISPRLAQLNKGKNAPPLWLKVKGIDQRDLDTMKSLLGISGNIPQAQEAMGRIDWIELAEDSGIPTISEEEFERRRAAQDEKALEKQRQQMELQKEMGEVPPGGGGRPPEQQNGKRPNGQLNQEEAIDYFIRALEANDLVVPVVVSDNEVIQLFNPHHDKAGRFTSAKGGGGRSAAPKGLAFSLDSSPDNQVGFFSKNKTLKLSDLEQKKLNGTISDLTRFSKNNFDGLPDISTRPVLNTKDWAEEVQTSQGIGFFILGLRKENELIVSPGVSSSLAGAGQSSKALGVSDKDYNKIAQNTVIHESIHARRREHEIPFEKDGRSVNLKNYVLSMEEGSTELLSQAAAIRKGSYSVNDAVRLGTYRDEVYRMTKEAQARYPDDPTAALKWVSSAHKTGFTPEGVHKSSGGNWAYEQKRFRYPKNVKPGGNGIDVHTSWMGSVEIYNTRDYENTLKWIFGGDTGDFKLEDTMTLQNQSPASVFQLFDEGKYEDAFQKMMKEEGRLDLIRISDYINYYAGDNRDKFVAALEKFIKEQEENA